MAEGLEAASFYRQVEGVAGGDLEGSPSLVRMILPVIS